MYVFMWMYLCIYTDIWLMHDRYSEEEAQASVGSFSNKLSPNPYSSLLNTTRYHSLGLLLNLSILPLLRQEIVVERADMTDEHKSQEFAFYVKLSKTLCLQILTEKS